MLKQLAIDLTPTVVNRTAIFHIALDTAAAFREHVSGYRYMRDFLADPITAKSELDARRGPVMSQILSDDGLIRERWTGIYQSEKRSRADTRLLMFDPLYVLFDEVQQDDVVLVLDLTPVTNPSWHHPRTSELYALAFKRLVASGARLGAISRNTALAMWANYGVPYDRITVVPLYLRSNVDPGAGDAEAVEPPEKVLLFVGSLEVRKNLSGLFKAFEASRLEEDGFRLVIAGGDGNGAEQIKADAAAVQGVELRGFVPDEELRRLYRTSHAFVYPSYLEGFGVPIIEAASWGLPIMTSMTGATAEVAPPGSSIVDPYSIAEIAEALRRAAAIGTDERSRIAAVNREHAARYNFAGYSDVMSKLLGLA